MSQMQDILKALEETKLKEKELEVRTKVLQKQNREMEETRAHVLRHKQELSEKRSLLLTLESQLEDVSVEKEILELRIRVRKQILDERVRRLQEPDEARENLLSLQKRKVELQRSFRKEADDYAATQAALGNLVDSYARVKEEAEEKFRQGSERKVKKEKLTRQIELLRSNLAETEATLKVKQLAIDTMHMDEDKNPEQLTETEASLMREIEELDKEIADLRQVPLGATCKSPHASPPCLEPSPRNINSAPCPPIKQPSSVFRLQPIEDNFPHGFQALSLLKNRQTGPKRD